MNSFAPADLAQLPEQEQEQAVDAIVGAINESDIRRVVLRRAVLSVIKGPPRRAAQRA